MHQATRFGDVFLKAAKVTGNPIAIFPAASPPWSAASSRARSRKPRLIALWRRHRQTLAIFILNLFLGWTLLGWVDALVWACTSDLKPALTT
jgi:Superinfection immunity protein